MPVRMIPDIEREWPAHLAPVGSEPTEQTAEPRKKPGPPRHTPEQAAAAKERAAELRRSWDRKHSESRNSANLARYYFRKYGKEIG